MKRNIFDEPWHWADTLLLIASIALAALSLALLPGCTATKYVPVETVRTEYVEADTSAIYARLVRLFESRSEKEARSDSIIDRSIETVTLNEKGDTTRHDKERIVYRSTNRERELEHRVAQQDSVIAALRARLDSVKTDSVAVPCPVVRELTSWERFRLEAFWWLAAALAIAVVWIAARKPIVSFARRLI